LKLKDEVEICISPSAQAGIQGRGLGRQARPSAIGRYTPTVMPGLDPGIHALPPEPSSERTLQPKLN